MGDKNNLFAGSAVDGKPAREVPATSAATAPAANPGLVRQLEARPTQIGKGPKPVDTRKWKNFDVVRGKASEVHFSVTKDDRMSAEEAGSMMERLQKKYGLDTAEEGVVWGFVSALFYAHTINSGSILQPGRCKIQVGDFHIDYVDIIRTLRENLRRFFRAYADDIAANNKKILDAYDPYDHESMEKYGLIMQVATERSMLKYPEYCHDSADACIDISPAVRAAIANGKRMVLSNIINAADTLHANTHVQTRDNFDSTNHESTEADRAAIGGRND